MAKAPRKARPPERGDTRMCTITTFSPVRDEHLAALTTRLEALRSGPSPFAEVPGTHFARLAVLGKDEFKPQKRPTGMRRSARLLDLLMHGGRAQRPDPPSRSYLLFSANYDGVPGAKDDNQYVDDLRLHLKTAADQIWDLCADYPGWSERDAFATFFAERTVSARYLFSASSAEPSVERTRSALRLRQQVIDLAVQTEGLSDDDLAKHLQAAFGSGFTGSNSFTGSSSTEPHGQQLTVRSPAPALEDPPTGADLLADPDRAVPSEPDLGDVQSLVASGYPRHESARHLLLRITDPISARRWLAGVADEIPTADWAGDQIDRLEYKAVERGVPGGEGRTSSPNFAIHVALSHAGLARLGLPQAELRGFSSEFRAGMASREAGLAPGRGTDPWLPPFAPAAAPAATSPVTPATPLATESAVDVLVMFSATDADALNSRLTDRPSLLPTAGDGLELLQQIEAARIREDRPRADGGKPGFREHFGFVDGISQPRIHGVTIGRRVAELPAGEVLLGYRDVDGDTAGAGLPSGLARNGSYLVYRKLEQNVRAFRELTERLAGRLEVADGIKPEELAAAKLMGRWRDGTPLTTSADSTPPPAHFGFQSKDAEGHGCPVGAHVRRANPRDSRPVDPNAAADTGGEAGLEATLALRHRMLRRGIPYGKPLPESSTDDKEERGLLFIALVGDLRRQFEFVQAHWMSDGNAFRLGTDRDVLAGASEDGNKFVVQGDRPVFIQPGEPLVTCRGGEYFFLPGIAALKRIAAVRPGLEQSPARSQERTSVSDLAG